MSETQPFVDSIIETHGGLKLWSSIKSIEVDLSFSGAILEVKGYPGTRHTHVTAFPQAYLNTNSSDPWLTFTNLSGDPTNKWFFSPKRVWIENAQGTLLQERSNPRAAFEGSNIMTPWDDLHMLYFSGYAIYNYISFPFALSYSGFDIQEAGTHTEYNETWRALQVTHPADNNVWPAHIQVQKFYFGVDDKLLKRIDYVTELFGGVASHYVHDYKNYGGWAVPTFRRVVGRVAANPGGYSDKDVAMLTKRTAFMMHYDTVQVNFEDGKVEKAGKRIH